MKTELRPKPENNFQKEFKKAQRYHACEHQQSNKVYNVAV